MIRCWLNVNVWIENEGTDEWEIEEREAQGSDEHVEAKNVDDLLRSSIAEFVDQSSPSDGVAAGGTSV